MVYHHPYITGEYNPPSNLNNPGFFIAQLVIAIFQTLHDRFMNLKRDQRTNGHGMFSFPKSACTDSM